MPTHQISSLNSGSQGLTTTAAALNGGTTLWCRSVILQADPDNTVDILLGSNTGQTIQLKPDDVLSLNAGENAVFDLATLLAKSVTSTATLNWMVV